MTRSSLYDVMIMKGCNNILYQSNWSNLVVNSAIKVLTGQTIVGITNKSIYNQLTLTSDLRSGGDQSLSSVQSVAMGRPGHWHEVVMDTWHTDDHQHTHTHVSNTSSHQHPVRTKCKTRNTKIVFWNVKNIQVIEYGRFI